VLKKQPRPVLLRDTLKHSPRHSRDLPPPFDFRLDVEQLSLAIESSEILA